MKKKLLYFLMLLGFAGLTNVNAKEIAADDIEPRTYIIGSHEFTENSTLTTRHIMLASKTIDGDTLNDMVIYYKNPRGKWINGLTGETIEVSEKFNIEFVDLVKFLTAPTLANDYNDKTKANLSILGAGYYGSSEETLKEISGWELYEKTADGYTKITEGTNYTYEVALTPGETKTFVARVYKLNETLDRVYSDYSNEVEVTRDKLNTPTLANDYNDKTKANLSILGAGYYGSSEETLKEISGWELYEKTTNGYSKITEGTNYTYQMELVPGETKTFVARVYKDKENGNRIYSEYSNELEVTREKLQTPTLARDFHYTNLAKLAITAEGYYGSSEETLKEITGWELYEKVGENYNKIKEGTEYFYTSNEFAPGETKVYVSRVYYETTDGNRIYSDYSNELEVSREKLQTPTLANDPSDLSGAHLSMAVEGYYASGEDALKEITGWELYEKTDSGYVQVTSDSTYSHNVSMEQGTTKTFIARVYYENENITRTYSDYSNEVVVTIEKIKVPTLTFSKNEDKMTLSIIDEGTYKDETEQNKITGWELYEKGETDTLITSDKPYTYEMDIPYGETKTYYARIYIVDVYNNKVYSENSAELVVNEKLPTPTLSNDYSYTDGAKLSILAEGYYGSDVEKKNMISGWELYEKTESGYSILTEGTDYTYELAMEVNTAIIFVARVYKNINGEKVYSEYSEEITIIKEVESQFNTDSWETIIANVKSGNIDNYNVGDTKRIDLGDYGTHIIRIANTSTPSECSTEGFSQTACGFVLEFANIITTHKTNDTLTNIGGWPATLMRTFVNDDIYNAMPDEIKNAIIDTTVVSGYGSEETDNFTSIDKLYLLSTAEVWAQGGANVINYDTARDVTRQLDYYANLGTSTTNYSGAIKKNGTIATFWRLRSPHSTINYSFFYVSSDGSWRYDYPNYARGVSPAFRIG